MIIFHHNDHDGHCAAAIAAKWGRAKGHDVRFVSLRYLGRPPIEQILPNEIVAIVDYSLKPDEMQDVFKITDNVIWCDHHVSCKNYDYGRQIEGLRDFNKRCLAGCELTWKHFFPKVPMPRGVSLIGDYDAWRHELQPQNIQFCEGLKLQNTNPDSDVWEHVFFDTSFIDQTIRDGEIVVKYRDAYCHEITKNIGHEVEFEGHKAFACNMYRFGSHGFGNRIEKYPLLLAYFYDGQKYGISLYSDSVDVSKLAEKYGGGGHAGSAAFISTTLPWIS